MERLKSVSVNQSEPECARVVLLLQCTKLKSELKGTRILRVRHQSTQKCTQVCNCRQECTKVPKIVPRLGPMDTLLGKKKYPKCTRVHKRAGLFAGATAPAAPPAPPPPAPPNAPPPATPPAAPPPATPPDAPPVQVGRPISDHPYIQST